MCAKFQNITITHHWQPPPLDINEPVTRRRRLKSSIPEFTHQFRAGNHHLVFFRSIPVGASHGLDHWEGRLARKETPQTHHFVNPTRWCCWRWWSIRISIRFLFISSLKWWTPNEIEIGLSSSLIWFTRIKKNRKKDDEMREGRGEQWRDEGKTWNGVKVSSKRRKTRNDR